MESINYEDDRFYDQVNSRKKKSIFTDERFKLGVLLSAMVVYFSILLT